MSVTRRRQLLAVGALVAVVAAAGALFMLARSGKDDSTTPQATASPALPRDLAAEDLGTGWSLVSESTLTSFATAPEPFLPAAPELPECHAIRTFEAELLARDSSFKSGSARVFTRSDGAARATVLRVEAASPDAAAAIVGVARTALSGNEVGVCVAEISRRNNLPVTIEALAPPETPPDGVSQVLRVEPSNADYAAATQAAAWWADGAHVFAVSLVFTGDALPEAELRSTLATMIERSKP